MKHLSILIYVLTAVCLAGTILDAVLHHQANTVYVCITAVCLCASIMRLNYKKK